MNRLSFQYRHDLSFFDSKLARDDFGLLTMSVTAEKFSGSGAFWAQWQDVKEFGESLDTYPIPADSPLKGQWGYDMQEGDDLKLSVEICPFDPRGNLNVRVEIADDEGQRVRASFRTNYPELIAFREQVILLIDGKIEEAVLEGH